MSDLPEPNQVHSPITKWAEDDRPREKLTRLGAKALSNAELMAIILGSGYQQYSAIALAQHIMQANENSFKKLASLDVKALQTIKGVGPAKAVSILAALEIANRKIAENVGEKPKITSSEAAFQVAQPYVNGLKHEEFWIILLNRANIVQDVFAISKGGVAATVVDTKIIFKQALLQLASGMILFHNHPSGNLKASNEDHNITQKIKDAAKLFDIAVLDHLIITENGYWSFADNGAL